MWSSPRPVRLGVDSILKACIKICQLLADYTPLIKKFLSPEKHVFVDALNLACSNFVTEIDDPGKPDRPVS